MTETEKSVLELMKHDAKISVGDIATSVGISTEDAETMIRGFEKAGIIVGYDTVINYDRSDEEIVTALIEVKVVPQKSSGFDTIAKRIYQYPEVDSVYLMSGAFDFTVVIEGKSIKEVSLFVADKLATLPAIQATATHFVLKKYKDHGIILEKDVKDHRLLVKA